MKKDEIFNSAHNKLRVLVAPLDWGLGHATRCIPIISKLLQQNCEVFVAAEGDIKILLQKEFPTMTFLYIKGYRMRYSRNRSWLAAKLLLQFPKLIYRVYAERRWLKKTVRQYKIDAVISDNRLGLSHTKIPCIYITHQLKIKTGNSFTESIAQKIHYRYINKYTTCWVPDAADETTLAGELSHPSALPKIPVKYLGPLSRFEKATAGNKYDLCIVLSGPEPQRTIFERLVLKDIKDFKGNVLLLRGLPGKTIIPEPSIAGLEIKNHVPAAELSLALQQSKIIICRSGYSSVMDLVKLQKKAILVPTPGQTEQEYLAAYLQDKKMFFSVEQKHFSLPAALNAASDLQFAELSFSQNTFESIVEDFVRELKENQ